MLLVCQAPGWWALLTSASALDDKLIRDSPYQPVLKHFRYMPGKITAVVEQPGELDVLVNVAAEHEVTWSVYRSPATPSRLNSR